MKAYIKKLQAKDEQSRKAILVGALALSMSFVCFVWISSLSNKLSHTDTVANKEAVKPFALFTDSVSNTFSNIGASVGSISFVAKKATPTQIDLIPVEPTQ
jgi:hypothetical protein